MAVEVLYLPVEAYSLKRGSRGREGVLDIRSKMVEREDSLVRSLYFTFHAVNSVEPGFWL